MKNAKFFFLSFLIVSFSFSSSRASGVIAAWYSVPVNDPALEIYAVFPADVAIGPEYQVMSSSIAFALPASLVGQVQDFSMTTVNGVDWTGSGVAGQCRLVSPTLSCNVAFTDLKVDLDVVRARLRAPPIEPIVLKDKLAVARAFSGELHGTVSFQLDGDVSTALSTAHPSIVK